MVQIAALPRFELPEDEAYRLQVLTALDLLDTPAEAEFDSVVKLAQHLFDCPIALVSLVDANRQWFKARCGLDATETPREFAFCHHALREPDMLVINDASSDPRFAHNPLVTGAPHIRFYAGVPLRIALIPGEPLAALGTLCVIDTKPRILSLEQARMLRHLAGLAQTIINGRLHIANAVRYGEARLADAARIERQHRQLAQAERMAGLGSWHYALKEDHLEWSDEVFAIHGLPLGALPSIDKALDFYPSHARPEIDALLAHTIQTGMPFDVEADFVAADGVKKRIRCLGELEVVDGRRVAIIGVLQDITARFAMEQTLRRSAEYDPLTGIANRAGFNAALDRTIEAASAAGSRLALALIDLDGFKQVNDVHGHGAGDELLKEVARRLESQGLARCCAARLGGDEFALIVSDPADCDAIDALGAELLAMLRRPIHTSEGTLRVSGTIGLSWFEPGIARSELMHRADLALYDGKRAGKGVVRFWAPGAVTPGSCGRRTGSRALTGR
jgi:diguanylate cyclase (GGDEF)-like protein